MQSPLRSTNALEFGVAKVVTLSPKLYLNNQTMNKSREVSNVMIGQKNEKKTKRKSSEKKQRKE
jgi:hypothetical protein